MRKRVVNALNTEAKLPCKLVLKPLAHTPDEITAICRDANYDDRCAGLVVAAHFLPGQMWINGLTMLNKTVAAIPHPVQRGAAGTASTWTLMNLNQTAHGGREFGFIGARVCVNNMPSLPVTGQDKQAHERIGSSDASGGL